MNTLTQEIRLKILKILPDATVHVLDPMQDGQHLQAIVISKSFQTMPLLNQHKLIMQALGEELKQSVHALGLKTFTPEKWITAQSQFPAINNS